jgi:ABC-type Fe3+ transport system permease subunit
MKLIPALILVLATGGCASQQYSAVAADAATTAVGLSIPGVVEMNPLGFATVPIRMAIIDHAKRQPIAEGTKTLHAVSASSWGAAANNALIVAGAGTAIALPIGIVVAWMVWKNGEPEREFWNNCEIHRILEENKALECVWTPT